MTKNPDFNLYSEFRDRPFYHILQYLAERAALRQQISDNSTGRLSNSDKPSEAARQSESARHRSPLGSMDSQRFQLVTDDHQQKRQKKPFSLEREFRHKKAHEFLQYLHSHEGPVPQDEQDILYSLAAKRAPDDSHFWSVIEAINSLCETED